MNVLSEFEYDDEYPEQIFSVLLGDDIDCETCGWSFNEAKFFQWSKDGEWMFQYSVGCYGGDSVTSHEENAMEKLEEIIKHLRTFSGWTIDEERRLRKFVGD